MTIKKCQAEPVEASSYQTSHFDKLSVTKQFNSLRYFQNDNKKCQAKPVEAASYKTSYFDNPDSYRDSVTTKKKACFK